MLSMSDDELLQQFHTEFLQEIVTTADSEEIYTEEALFEVYSPILSDANEFDESIYAHYKPSSGGIRVDGYCGNPLENHGTLGLIVVDLCMEPVVTTITNTEISSIFKRLSNFLKKALLPSFKDGLEETDPGYGLADLIQANWERTKKIKLFLMTNRSMSSRVENRATEEFDGRPLSYSVWDLSRVYKLISSGQEREKLTVDFRTLPGGPLRALKAFGDDSSVRVFLAALPGMDLALIYNRWGNRLLEQNVRVFLQARSSVNRGIKNTLKYEPEHFFSFNNGITATAERIETEDTPDGTVINVLDNLQIVNGGQTTASIYAAFMGKFPLDRVFVQMKLSIVKPEEAIDLVPRISRCANSQNKVSAADFSSTHPYHVRIEEFSRRIYTPSKEGSFIDSKWYYERVRGQYRDELAYRTPSGKKKFADEYPKAQTFTKTDLAKYLMCWTDKVYYVNRGAQKNFAEFTEGITAQWDKDDKVFSEYYFKCLVAKKIIFDAAQRTVPTREWYESGGYRSQHVTFVVGKIAHDVQKMGKVVDFLSIWNAQKVSDAFIRALEQSADCVHVVLMSPDTGYRNISEWAKQPRCWERIKKTKVDWDPAFVAELKDKAAEKETLHEAAQDQKILNGIEAQEIVCQEGAEFWNDVYNWMIREGEGSDKDRGIVHTAASMTSRKIPSEKQCIYLLNLMKKLRTIGCPYKLKHRSRRDT